jgi:hypothetical protein
MLEKYRLMSLALNVQFGQTGRDSRYEVIVLKPQFSLISSGTVTPRDSNGYYFKKHQRGKTQMTKNRPRTRPLNSEACERNQAVGDRDQR